MPIYDFQCDRCRRRQEHFFSRLAEAQASEFACSAAETDDDCLGTIRKAAVDGGAPVYQMSIERFLEVRRGHLSTFKQPPLQHSKSGAGIRRWPGKD